MKLALSVLMFVHGAIHLLGFVKWWGLSPVAQLGAPWFPSSAGRGFAAWWLLATLLFAAAAVLRLIGHGWGWVALAAIAVSQVLVVLTWKDAKYGTLANLVVLVAALAAISHERFLSMVDREIRALDALALRTPASVVSAADLERLPPPVRRWLDASGVVGKPRARIVRLKQRGELRTGPGAEWLPATAEQSFSVPAPGFVWRVDASMFGFVPITGRDRFVEGRGEMLIQAGSLVPVVNAHDDKIAMGSALRFLAETMWFPSAALEPVVVWAPVDEMHARATLTHAGLSVTGVFSFDEAGNVTGVSAERYLGSGGDAKLTPWGGRCSEWRAVRGVRIPVRGEVWWKLPEGEFSYYRWEILDVESDPQ